MKAAVIQYAPDWENPGANIDKLEEILKDVKDEDLLIFPEMTLTGFTMNSEKFAEEIDGISHRYFMDLARRRQTDVIAGLIERDHEKIYNTAVHIDGKGLITAKYRKIHPFSFAKEDEFYCPGEEIIISKIKGVQTGLTICYDLRFPELYRLCTKQGAEIIVNIANWPTKRIAHWIALLKARAIENQCYVIGVNRVGADPYNEYNGCSAVFDPMGLQRIMLENSEGAYAVELELNEIKETRERLPFLNDIKLI